MNLDQALQTFIVECRELLNDMENALLNIEQMDDKSEAVNAIFRAAHTIKGSAGLFGLDHFVNFTHVVESLLDEVRDGALHIDSGLTVLLLSCFDYLSGMTDALADGQINADSDMLLRGAPLVAQLQRYLGPEQVSAHPGGAVATCVPAPLERIGDDSGHADHWHISLRFGAGVLQNGLDLVSFLRYLGKIGRIVRITAVPDAMPAAVDMDPELCYLGFEIAFETTAGKGAIESVFEFVLDDCALHILPPKSRLSEFIRLISQLPERPARLGEILVRCGSLTERELEQALAAQAATSGNAAPLGSIMVDQGSVEPVVLDAALAKQKRSSESKAQESKSIRVDSDKLDHLINLVGELIIASARAAVLGQRESNNELQECTSVLSDLVESVRDAALELRMVKIGATFNRFQRVVHDVSHEIGKDIALLVNGEDAGLDKTVVEKIGDPLMHLVRNAIDHGIEAADVRVARGKPARGTVSLNAFHDSGSIVIEVSDDGGGLKRDRIMAKAIERSLVDADAKLSDAEIYGLIFEPGFSTAESVTNLSGRGVGMDVVKRNILALRGSVGIDSEEGVGTTVSVRLPLTLAIINGFLVQVGESVFVIPLDVIEECIEFLDTPERDYADLRGAVLPFIRLRSVFRITAPPTRRQSIVVIKHGGGHVGVVVDILLGEFQTVIKPLSPMFNGIDCISGSTILGNGAVALILDVGSLFKASCHTQKPAALLPQPVT